MRNKYEIIHIKSWAPYLLHSKFSMRDMYIKSLSIHVSLKSWLTWIFGVSLWDNFHWLEYEGLHPISKIHLHLGGLPNSLHRWQLKKRGFQERQREVSSWVPSLRACKVSSWCGAHQWPARVGGMGDQPVRPSGGYAERTVSDHHTGPPLLCGVNASSWSTSRGQ